MSTSGGAGERTALAFERTRLARERTYASWIRTGLAAMAAGVVVARWAAGPGATSFAIAIGIALIGAGALMTALGYADYMRSGEDGEQPRKTTRRRWSIHLATLLVLASAIGIAMLLVL